MAALRGGHPSGELCEPMSHESLVSADADTMDGRIKPGHDEKRSVLCWLGGHSGGIPPDPIPNSAVKASSAHGTASQDAGESVVARPAKNGFCFPPPRWGRMSAEGGQAGVNPSTNSDQSRHHWKPKAPSEKSPRGFFVAFGNWLVARSATKRLLSVARCATLPKAGGRP